MPVRLAVLDDNQYVRSYAHETRPVSSTFNQFVEAVGRSPRVDRVNYLIPVRNLRIWEVEPALEAVDESIVDIVRTHPFDGITDYLLRAGWLTASNWAPIDRAIAGADLVWLRLPASNALLALTAARRRRVPVFSWIAGSVGDVNAAQRRVPPLSAFGRIVGRAYDAVTDLAREAGPALQLDAEFFASTITAAEIDESRAATGNPTGSPMRIVWAGRMGREKGLRELVEVVRLLIEHSRDIVLVLVGDGPAHKSIERDLRALGDRVEEYGYVGDRAFYMHLLRNADVLVHTSRAEGVPKVIIDAMAAGTPIVATEAGAVADVLANGTRGVVVRDEAPISIAAAVAALMDEPLRRAELRARALDWVAARTARAQADRLVTHLTRVFPDLDWSPRAEP
jgi:glycosyltransferase involved in cell wall biosynthesis